MARCEALLTCLIDDESGFYPASNCQCPSEATTEMLGIDPDGGPIPYGRTVDLCWCHAETLKAETREVEFIPSIIRAVWAAE